MLFTPARHEPLIASPFDEAAARESIARIAARAEQELDATAGLWPLDDDDAPTGGSGRASSLYWGGAGIAWALDELAGGGYVGASVVDRGLVDALEARILGDPDDPDFGEEGVWFGVAGVLAVAEHRWPDPARRDRIMELARASLPSPALEPMVGHPGYMALAAQIHDRTGDERWAAFWSAGAERLLAAWHYDDALEAWLWTQRLGEHDAAYLGAAHGLVGNVHVLRRGGALLAAVDREDVDRRAIETLTRFAVVEDDCANWPGIAGNSLIANERIRVQWCHGAAGVLTGMWDAGRDDDGWSELLLAAGRLVWAAGPLRDAPGLCHGTAGNAYALLALWRRTGEEQWLERARLFAQHAAAQVEERASRLGHGRHSLFTGDEGVALCLASCLAGDVRVPVADRLV